MTMTAQAKAVLTGPALIDEFLKELVGYVKQNPDHEVTGSPLEIVEDVLCGTTRFTSCSEKSLREDLPKQLVMAVNCKGGPLGLLCQRTGQGRIKVRLI